VIIEEHQVGEIFAKLENIAVGAGALGNANGGNDNTAVGEVAGLGITTLSKQFAASVDYRFEFQNAVNLSSECTTKRFPSPRCASARQIPWRTEISRSPVGINR
jgi:hypothetical protein